MRKNSKGDVGLIEAVGEHIAKYFGEPDGVYHEIASDDVHVDVYVVGPTRDRPYHILVTSGMSERPMMVPKGFQEGKYAEVMICLPKDWPMSEKDFESESNWWPIRVLKGVARYPHANSTWLYGGHSIQWSHRPKPFATNTRMNSVLLLRPMLIPNGARFIHVTKKKEALLWGVFPLYQEELKLKISEGSDRIEELFRQHGITELLNRKRINVASVK